MLHYLISLSYPFNCSPQLTSNWYSRHCFDYYHRIRDDAKHSCTTFRRFVPQKSHQTVYLHTRSNLNLLWSCNRPFPSFLPSYPFLSVCFVTHTHTLHLFEFEFLHLKFKCVWICYSVVCRCILLVKVDTLHYTT